MLTSPNRLLGVVAGIVFMLVGLLGFVIATPYPFATPQGGVLIGLFESNALLALIHTLVGAALLLAGLASATLAKVANMLIGIGLFLFGVYGLFLGHTEANIFALNSGTIVLHFLSGLLLAVLGLAIGRIYVVRTTA
ncbi:hypothetical protein AX769_02745 [Frondihabitans sp. PAMC 28766]|uniref:DUF4383 domain-containing protein n=1 Tax=Frondihabitans sp. PAMC 28766 TaxID=1795630 RepID=UPI00078EAEDD|nr:DUF4383 domain-containing protein [Frondihabitans sp. PAMC 28766]AMM19248.1 hypothetical protein AX769_02745 [Frondihabitans sp. PAMC 28766]